MYNNDLSEVKSALTISYTAGAIVTMNTTRTRLINKNGVITAMFQATLNTDKGAGVENTLLTFNSDLSPAQNVYGVMQLTDGNTALFYVSISGSIIFTGYQTIAKNTVLFGQITWFVGK